MAGKLVCSDGKIYDLDIVDNCIDKIMETLKKSFLKKLILMKFIIIVL